MAQIIDVVGLWRNSGANVIGALADATNAWFDTTGVYNPAVDKNFIPPASVTSDVWKRIPLRGADMLEIQLNTRIKDVGALTNVTGSDLQVQAVGQAVGHADPNFDHPWEVDNDPTKIVDANRPDTLLWAQGYCTNAAVAPANTQGSPTGGAHSANGFIHNGIPVLDQRHTVVIRVGERCSGAFGAAGLGVQSIPLLVSGFDVVWVAVRTFATTYDGGTAATKVAGKLVAILKKFTYDPPRTTWGGSV